MKEFTEPAPEVGCADWGTKFQEWWWRKCAFYKVDPINTFMEMLGPDDDEINQFIDEFDQGKHQLSIEDEKALESSWLKLKERLRNERRS